MATPHLDQRELNNLQSAKDVLLGTLEEDGFITSSQTAILKKHYTMSTELTNEKLYIVVNRSNPRAIIKAADTPVDAQQADYIKQLEARIKELEGAKAEKEATTIDIE